MSAPHPVSSRMSTSRRRDASANENEPPARRGVAYAAWLSVLFGTKRSVASHARRATRCYCGAVRVPCRVRSRCAMRLGV